MNSWDCFDTLIARIYYDPKTIFDEVGRRINDLDFKEKRIRAEKKSKIKSYEDIYKRLPEYNPAIELDVELEHNFPIVENIKKVKHGDLILSDMYLPKEFIMKLLRNCGLTANVDIIVTPNGKKKGWIWDSVKQKYNIQKHYGDNYKSDVLSAQNNDVFGVHDTAFNFNSLEKQIYEKDTNLACWMRYVRLQCPYNDPKQQEIWNDQANINLPVLALATLELPNKPIAFTMRDCVYWQPLYKAMTGNSSTTLYSSRHCYKNPNEHFIEYIRQTSNGKIIVDLLGSGKSIHNFFKNQHLEYEAFYIASGLDSPQVPIMVKAGNSGLERHNSSPKLKPLVDFNADGPIFGKYERDVIVSNIQSNAMDLAVKSSKYFNIKRNKELLQFFVDLMDNDYTTKNTEWSSKRRKK